MDRTTARIAHPNGVGRNQSYDLPNRLLALDIRSKKTGFVVLETTNLVDWGVKTYSKSLGGPTGAAIGLRLDWLLDHHRPHVMVVRQATGAGADAGTAVRRITERIRVAASRRGVRVRVLSSDAIRKWFARRGCQNKYEVALQLVEWFDELAWTRPPKRKPWQPESHHQPIFDAAAAAMVFASGEN